MAATTAGAPTPAEWAATPGAGAPDDPRGLFALATMMFDSDDDRTIAKVLMRSASALGSCRALAVRLDRDDATVWATDPGPRLRHWMDARLAALHGQGAALSGRDDGLNGRNGPDGGLNGRDGPREIGDAPWAWAFGIAGPDGHCGHLIVAADAAADAEHRAALRTLARQAGAALANAALRRRERDHARRIRELSDERALVAQRLSATASDLRRQRAMDEAFANVSASGEGETGIARVVYEITGLPVIIEDRLGDVRAAAGTSAQTGAADRAQVRGAGRDEMLRLALHRPGATRDGDLLVGLARSRGDILGLLILLDPDRKAGPAEALAVEQGAALLAMHLEHRLALTRLESRLRRDLVDDLVSGTDADAAYVRSAAIGHDLHRPHHVAALSWRGVPDEAIERAVGRVAATRGIMTSTTRRDGRLVLIVEGEPDPTALYQGIARELGSVDGSVGVGGRCDTPDDFPRSYREATRALRVRSRSRSPSGATAFESLGIFRILGEGGDDGQVERFVREWLGRLLDYDSRHHCDLVGTIAEYLDQGGNYQATTAALTIHRSTLRYRLRRIREITGLDLHDVDQRLNLHVATRAWRIRGDADPG